MGIILRQSISGFIYTIIGVVLGFLITGLFMPRFFQPEEIGLLRVLISYANVMSTFAILGFSIVSVKIFPVFRDKATKHHGFFGLSFWIGVVGFLVASLVYLGFRNVILENGVEKSALFNQYFYSVVPLTFFLMFYMVIDTYFRILYQTVIGIVYREIVQRVLIILVFALFYLNYINFNQNVYLYLASYSLPTLFLFGALLRKHDFSFIPDLKFLNKPLVKEIAHVGLYGIFSSLAGILVINIDILMLNQMQGLAQTGIYAITFFFGALVLIPSRSLTKISSVIIADAFNRDDLKEVDTIYKKSSINLGIIGMLILIGLWGNLDNVFHIIGEEFRPGQWVIIIIGFSNLLDMLMGISNQIFFNSKYYTTSAYLSLFFMLMLIVTNLIFIPEFGILGAAWAALLSKFIYSLIKYLFLWKKFNFQPFDWKTIALLALGIGTIFLVNLLPVLPNYLIDILVRSSLISLIFGAGVLLLNLSEDVNQWVEKMWTLLKIWKNKA